MMCCFYKYLKGTFCKTRLGFLVPYSIQTINKKSYQWYGTDLCYVIVYVLVKEIDNAIDSSGKFWPYFPPNVSLGDLALSIKKLMFLFFAHQTILMAHQLIKIAEKLKKIQKHKIPLSGVRVGGGGSPPLSYTKKGQRWANPKYCDCDEVRDQESGSVWLFID